MVAGLLVTSATLLYTGSWGVIMYEATVRVLTEDGPYESVWTYLWVLIIVQLVVTALARAVGFRELRATTVALDAPPTGTEAGRITLASLYIFVTTTVVLPWSRSERRTRTIARSVAASTAVNGSSIKYNCAF